MSLTTTTISTKSYIESSTEKLMQLSKDTYANISSVITTFFTKYGQSARNHGEKLLHQLENILIKSGGLSQPNAHSLAYTIAIGVLGVGALVSVRILACFMYKIYIILFFSTFIINFLYSPYIVFSTFLCITRSWSTWFTHWEKD